MLDQIAKLIRVATGFTVDVGSTILTQGAKHDQERKLLCRGTTQGAPTAAFTVYEQASNMLDGEFTSSSPMDRILKPIY
jgi:hypothetical protein